MSENTPISEYATVFPDLEENNPDPPPTTPAQLKWLLENRERLPDVLWQDFSYVVFGGMHVCEEAEVYQHCFLGGMLAMLDVLGRLGSENPEVVQKILEDCHKATVFKEQEIVGEICEEDADVAQTIIKH